MKNKKKRNRMSLLAATVAVLVVLICGGIYLSATAYTERSAVISSDGTSVNVRKGPGTSYSWVATLAHGTEVTIIGEDVATDGSKWYEIRFTVDESTKTGFVHSTYVVYTDYSGIDEEDLPSFEVLLEDFPESYKDALLTLYDMYPSWKFVPVHTGLQWSDVLAEESSKDRSLVSTTAISSWKSLADGDYDWNTSTWIGKDGDKWVTASEGIVAHYLDPRNYLNGSMIFAFIAHAYDAEAQTLEGVQAIMANTFMMENFIENDQVYSYAEVLMEAAREYGVSPYVLAASIRIEIGADGASPSISGVVEGFEGLYNYYNVSAYATGGHTANEHGLWWAAGAGIGATTYGRPWDSRYKALMGGAEYYAANYVARGQNTLYLKKFNITGNNTYNHQYMTNIQGAASEAHAYSRAYNAEAKLQNLVFYIPVYENMPETACPKPTGYGSPNNKLDAITIDGEPIDGFDMDTGTYVVGVDALADKVELGAVPKDSTASVTGTGEVEMELGEKTLTILCTAQNGDERTYTVTLVRTEDAELGELSVTGGTLSPEFDGDILDYKVFITGGQADIIVSASPRDEMATLEINGEGEGLTPGSEITVEVTAKDGETTKVYRLTVEEYQEPEPEPDESESDSGSESESESGSDSESESESDSAPGSESDSSSDGESDSESESGSDGESESESDSESESSSESGSDNEPEVTTIMYPTCDVNVRSGSGVGYDVIGVLKAGQQVTVIGEFTSNGWAKIEFDGGIGYCYGEYLSGTMPTEPPTTEPEAVITVDSEVYTVGENHYITGITDYPVMANSFVANLSIDNGTVKVYKADGETLLDGSAKVGTGALAKIYDLDGELYDTYTVLIYGDVSGDGAIDALDMLMIQKNLKKLLSLGTASQLAADVSRDDRVDALDMLMIQKKLMKIYEIVQ